jgi:Flp pilus assembly protein TadG
MALVTELCASQTFQGEIKMKFNPIKKIRTVMKGSPKGQSILAITIALPVFIGGLTMLIDIGDLFVTHVKLQTASDSAVLAGGNYLPSYPDSAVSAARQYAIANGIASSEIKSVTVAADSKSVSIAVTRNVPCFFCAALGVTSAHAATTPIETQPSAGGVSAGATAAIVPIRSAKGVSPVAVDYRTNLNFGQSVTLKMEQVGAGDWDPLALGGNGGNNFKANLQNGYSGLLTVGDTLTLEPGNMSGPANQGIGNLVSAGLSKYPNGTFSNHALDDPRVITVPIVDFTNSQGRTTVPLKGFAVMWVVSVTGQGNINCYFIQESVPGSIPDPTATGYGATSPVVIK